MMFRFPLRLPAPWLNALLVGGLMLGMSVVCIAAESDSTQLAEIGSEATGGLSLLGKTSSETPSWLSYFSTALGLLNLLLIFWLYRSSGTPAPSPVGQDAASESSGRTQRRLDKRKREIDELRTRLEALDQHSIPATAAPSTALTPEQIQALVREQVRDELARLAATATVSAANGARAASVGRPPIQ